MEQIFDTEAEINEVCACPEISPQGSIQSLQNLAPFGIESWRLVRNEFASPSLGARSHVGRRQYIKRPAEIREDQRKIPQSPSVVGHEIHRVPIHSHQHRRDGLWLQSRHVESKRHRRKERDLPIGMLVIASWIYRVNSSQSLFPYFEHFSSLLTGSFRLSSYASLVRLVANRFNWV